MSRLKRLAHMHLRPILLLASVVCATMPVELLACNVPVFRYAMERWSPDPYQVVVLHRAAPRDAAIEVLQEGVKDLGGAGNYVLNFVDVATPAGKTTAERRKIVTYPWVEIYYPIQSQVRTPIWSGPLTLDRARRILNSPGRSRLAEMLLSGEVAVWILVKSGHEQKDRRARKALEANLTWASANLKIPETGVDESGNPLEVKDFKTYPVRFGLIEVARDDPKEDLLISALIQSEPDLGGYDEPIAYPVFGRGRALYALVGSGIQEKTIREACQAMLAWCSCEIKSQNPGTDLLIAADWSRPIGGRMVKDPSPPLTGLSTLLPTPEAEPAVSKLGTGPANAPALCKLTPPTRSSREPEQSHRLFESPLVRNLVYLAGGAGALILGLSVFLTVRAKK